MTEDDWTGCTKGQHKQVFSILVLMPVDVVISILKKIAPNYACSSLELCLYSLNEFLQNRNGLLPPLFFVVVECKLREGVEHIPLLWCPWDLGQTPLQVVVGLTLVYPSIEEGELVQTHCSLSKTEEIRIVVVVVGITLSLYICVPELSYSHMTSGLLFFLSKFGQYSVRFVSRVS